jgi:hypothetical protein
VNECMSTCVVCRRQAETIISLLNSFHDPLDVRLMCGRATDWRKTILKNQD